MSELFCIDPGINTAEIESFNLIMSLSPIPVSYHLPAQQGMRPLIRRENITSLKGLIILGSVCSVHDKLDWQEEFHHWVKDKLIANIPILAICYGHQLIAHLLGASIKKAPKVHKGLRQITLLANNRFTPQQPTGRVVVSHQEEVCSLPPNMDLLAQSDETPFEGLYHRHKPIWTFQSHIEANTQFCQHNHILLLKQVKPFLFGQQILKTFISKLATNN